MLIKDYVPLKYPDGMSDGLIFSWATGKQLDIFGERVNVQRKKLLCIKEPDAFYKIRIRNEAIRRK